MDDFLVLLSDSSKVS